MRQAVDATLESKSLEEYAKTHKELMLALQHWQT
jgi:ribulose 1,5-bisphosphate carboxylase large subunit-like protein